MKITQPGPETFLDLKDTPNSYSGAANDGVTVTATENGLEFTTGGGGGAVWGSITGTLSNQTDLQTALDGKVDENVAITGATKTKLTYDAKGLVTAGADATTADIADSLNRRYVTDAELVVIGNTSGTNTGDQTSIVGITGTIAQFNTALTDGDFATGGGTVTGTSSGTNTGDQTITLTGDVTGSGTGSFATTISAGAVDIAMLSATGTPDSTTFLRGDNTWATPAGGVSDGDKGDITVTSSGTVWTIDNGVVTAAKTSITGTPDGTKYLRDDFSWQAVAGGSGLTSPQVLARASLCV